MAATKGQKVDKVIITNFGALTSKYGSKGLAAIRSAVSALVKADKRRGLKTVLLGLDDKTAMARISVKPVKNAANPKENKDAVDGVYHALAADYLMLMGSIDVIPHQDLRNPLYTSPGGDDPDRVAYGDIPYACEAPYSRRPQDFVGPTRVVGRLPDITGGTDPSYLVGLLATATNWKAVSHDTLGTYMAVTAAIWKASSKLSTATTFGNSSNLKNVPSASYKWSSSFLRKRMHFFNCHGALGSSQFFGQPTSGAESYPVAHDAAYVDGKIREGTIAAAECCYGGELYALSTARKQPGLCNIYLKNKSYGFFASTTIAYGPESGNEQADLICQYFLQSVLAGASLGRAALEARQKFVGAASPADPADTKTLAQFNLYGDPSITPLTSSHAPTLSKSIAALAVSEPPIDRQDRRRLLVQQGLALQASEPVIRRTPTPPRSAIRNALRAEAGRRDLTTGDAVSFRISYKGSAKSAPRLLFSRPTLASAYHVLFARSKRRRGKTGNRPAVPNITLLIGKEVNGNLVSIEATHSR